MKKNAYVKPILKTHGDLKKNTTNTEIEGESDAIFYTE